MKIIAFTDLHGDSKRLNHLESLIKLKKPELIICAGDLSIFGRNLSITAKRLNSFNIPLLLIPGNHELEKEIEEICEKNKNLINIHKKLYDFNGFQFFGSGLGGFSQKDKEFEKQFEKIKAKIKDPKKFIFVSHGPPYKTKLDKLYYDYVGSITFRKFIEFTSPIVAISGHIHETEHKEDKIKSTRVINPGDGEFITIG